MVLGSLVTGRAERVSQLMVGRFIQGVGASPGLSVGAAVIGDIYKLEERGAALGTYFGVSHSGSGASEPNLIRSSPDWPYWPCACSHYWRSVRLCHALQLIKVQCTGGIAHYSSWRAVHYWLAVMGYAILFFILLFLPETSHPDSRGIDEYKKSGKPLPKWRPVILNPIANLSMLRSLNITSTVRYMQFHNLATSQIQSFFSTQALAGCFALLTDVGESLLFV